MSTRKPARGWVIPGSDAASSATRSKRPAGQAKRANWRPITAVVLTIVAIGMFTVLPPFFGAIEGAYYRVAPTPEMHQLKVLRASLPLPKPVHTDYDDLGCHTTYFLWSRDGSRCTRSITLDFATTSFVPSFQAHLRATGWKQTTYETYGVKLDYDTFHYSKGAGSQRQCIDGLVHHDTNDPWQTVVWLYGATDTSCSS